MELIRAEAEVDKQDRKEMLDKRRRFQLARLITLSEEMLDCAQAGDWERVEELEVLRRVELDECFALQHQNPSMLIAQALATLIHINEQVVFLVKNAREQVNCDQGHEFQAHKAASAYQQSLD